MLLPLVFFACLVQTPQAGQSIDKGVKLYDTTTGNETGLVYQVSDPLTHKQISPKAFSDGHWEFEWMTVGYEKISDPGKALPRIRVFSQERTPDGDTAFAVARMLERLWEYNYTHLKIDHSPLFGDGVVDCFLCKGGRPGGEQRMDLETSEQRFDNDQSNGPPRKVNTIYIYDLDSFKDPMEMAREVAHEYGHATLSGVNGYKEPEDWANGFLGEKLFLNYAADAMAAKTLDSNDLMGLSEEKLDEWVNKNVRPLIFRAAEMGPSPSALKARNKQGMDDFIGLALYMHTLFPEAKFSRSLLLIPSAKAEEYLDAILLAAEEGDPYTLRIPSWLVGKQIWVPLGKSKIRGAQVLDTKLHWVKIKAPSTPVDITPPANSD